MVQDQYRAVMQYSGAYRNAMQYGVAKESMGKEKIVTDWYCAKVSFLKPFGSIFIIDL